MKLPKETAGLILIKMIQAESAKKASIVAVDEIIELCEFDVASDVGNQRYIDKLNYWDEVKKELEGL
jgi:hypothetical protein